MDEDKNGKVGVDEFIKGMYETEGISDEGGEPGEIPHQKELEREKFKKADLDGDGNLDADELPGLFYPETNEGVLDVIVADSIKQKDKDGDGMLTVKEFFDTEEPSPEEERDFKSYDADASGKLSLAEVKEWESGRLQMAHSMSKLFEAADKDGDKHITADEVGKVNADIVGSDAYYHMSEWASH